MLKSSGTPFATRIASGLVVAFTALLGGAAVFLPGVPVVKAAPLPAAAHQHLAKADRLPVLVKGTACTSLGWPHYEQKCQFDIRRPADDVRPVRVIASR
jgi:hypothetical protein